MTINVTAEDKAVFDRFKSTGKITGKLRHVITREYNKCSVCNELCEEGRPLFAGYNVYGSEMLAHAQCTSTMCELATPVYWTGQPNVSVPDNQTVWRYMDFSKLVALLLQQGLYLPRADQLDDKFEGAMGNANREAEFDEFYRIYFRHITTLPISESHNANRSENDIEQNVESLLQSLKIMGERARSSLVSCWHANDGESEALWRLYCPPLIAGVAIRSTVGKLWNAMQNERHAVVGRVHYVDFKKQFAHLGNERLFFKRRSLSHENEVRIVIGDHGNARSHDQVVQCDLNALIDEVVISPFSQKWFGDVVKNIIKRMELSINCRQSELLEKPFY